MGYVEGKTPIFMIGTKKDKFIKLLKYYLSDFINKVEGFGKQTEVS